MPIKKVTDSTILMQDEAAKMTGSPTQLYTLKQALERLHGMTQSTFYRRVDEGRIRSIVPAGRKYKMYVKEDVDKIAQEMADFDKRYKISEE